MPVFAVNSLGVSAAMSFICGLSTMATLIEPPFPVPEAEDPLEPPDEFELSEPPPPQPAAIPATTANTAATDQGRRVPLICSLLLLQRGGGCPPQPNALIALVYVGCQANRGSIRSHTKTCRIGLHVFRLPAWSGQPRLALGRHTWPRS